MSASGLKCFSRLPILFIGSLSLFLIYYSKANSSFETIHQRLLVAPPPMLDHMVVGYKEVAADLLWIRAIQDLDYCDQVISETQCKNQSWVFKMIDTITELAPSFRMPYSAGALALTVMVSDIDGATKIFNKAVKQFPQDWQLHYRAAYHFLYEVHDKRRAADLLIEAGKYGAPKFVFTLAGRLYSDAGYLDLAESLLNQMIVENQDPILIERLRSKIASIRLQQENSKNK